MNLQWTVKDNQAKSNTIQKRINMFLLQAFVFLKMTLMWKM